MCRSLLQATMKSEALEKHKGGYEVLKINFTDENNHLEKREMYLGFPTGQELRTILRKCLAT